VSGANTDPITGRSLLSFTSTRDGQKKRNIRNTPLFIAVYFALLWLARLISLLNKQENPYLLYLFGDVGYFLGIEFEWNMVFLLWAGALIWTQIIYYYNYKQDIKPNFLNVFKVMSGHLPPRYVDLTNEPEVIKLVSLSKKLFKIIKINNQMVIPPMVIAFMMTTYVIKLDFITALLFGIPNALFLAGAGVIFCNFMFYQFIYFYITCFYLKLKLDHLNKCLTKITMIRKFSRIYTKLKSFDRLYHEIDKYNSTYFSKYLMMNWLVFGVPVSIWTSTVIFSSITIFLKTIIGYITVIFAIMFILLLLTASSVNKRVYDSYQIINSLHISLNKKISIFARFKVCYILYLIFGN
jgi:hypothetical protein